MVTESEILSPALLEMIMSEVFEDSVSIPAFSSIPTLLLSLADDNTVPNLLLVIVNQDSSSKAKKLLIGFP